MSDLVMDASDFAPGEDEASRLAEANEWNRRNLNAISNPGTDPLQRFDVSCVSFRLGDFLGI